VNFYPFHIGDYISHTSHLTDEEDLAYRRMIDLYYMGEVPFPDDPAWIARRVKSNPAIVLTLLEEFFELSQGGSWHNTRADREIAKYQFVKESGKKGAEKRWSNREEKPLQMDANAPPIATPLATKTITKTNTNIKTILTPEGVSDSVFNDYLEVRKGKKAKWTETALKGLVREAGKAGISLNQAMTICCERNWVSLKAEWLKQDQPKEAKMSNFWAQIEGGK
jgi:uncharacterized protein YdaU (DUF1376 family)